MLLDERMDEFSRALGADFFGVADLSSARSFMLEYGGKNIARYPRAVSVGIRLLDTIVDELPHSHDPSVSVNYRHHAHDIINLRLDLVTSRIASLIQNEGYRALPIPSSKRVDDKKIAAAFSHKLAANLAGLGWIGKSCLLITPEAGPRVRWGTVLTDAPFKAGEAPMEDRCGKCTDCVDACPVNAFTGTQFNPEEARESRYDARRCERYLQDLEKMDKPGVCGMCIYACPHGMK
ncbi:4Fe-4S double cluster binding domain-containing protein [Methanobacterium aggregans]|uniref:4Fe-4S double cluster binding domain-containing protein n=1 Tax=Methanobacterium aggregans TaxID=1615586 RepID=UPI001AE1BBC8|nr:4Fe-4S double cluster binding domain-containing protein [Methanobacterium aggregans]MBP2045817.1 epoxyqueuosine reductase QueG [Methanobacterium aggregans]